MEQKVKEILAEHYGLPAERITPLEGYGSENYKIESNGRSFVLKLYKPDLEPHIGDLLAAENRLLNRLALEDRKSFPVPQINAVGDYLAFSDQLNRYLRLLTYVEGDLLTEVEHTPELFFSYGKFLAEMDRKMLDFRHLAIEARKFKWDLQYYHLTREYVPFIKEPADRKLVEYFFLQNRELVEPKIRLLRKSVIHGDTNDWNVLAAHGEICGIIDFGDICCTPLINELAIAMTYCLLDKEDPFEWAVPLIRGYHLILPLEELEIELLYYLVATRLGVTLANAANARRRINFTDYMVVSEQAALRLLRKWVRINPASFENKLRKAAGFPTKLTDTTAADLVKRHRHTSRALALQFAEPIKMQGAAFQYMYDALGNTFLDCYNNIPQVGHCHPRVVAAGQRAMARLNTNTRYLSDIYNDYAENLTARFPAGLTKVFFVNSGSAASDLAIRLALTHTKNKGIVVIEHGYHGNTRLGIDISHYKYDRKGGSGKAESIIEAEIPDAYKGKYAGPSAGQQYAAELIEKIKSGGLPPAAFIAEPVVGCGGQVPLADGYLQEIYPFIRSQGGVCISDEVQTGFGRLGTNFWGFEMHGVVPDIVVLGKPMGNGHPLAAVITTAEIAASFETGMEFFSSFGGNTVSCAIGQAVLDVLDEENLPENARLVGAHLLGLLEQLVEKYEVCGDARGAGLFLGLELVTDKQSKAPATELASAVKNKLKANSILIGTDGPFDNVLKIKPPLCFTRENAVELAGNIDGILEKSGEIVNK